MASVGHHGGKCGPSIDEVLAAEHFLGTGLYQPPVVPRPAQAGAVILPDLPITVSSTSGIVDALLPQSVKATVDSLSAYIYVELIGPALRQPSAAKYIEFFQDHWHEYCETIQALHVLIARLTSEERAVHFAQSSFNDLLDILRPKIVALAGNDAPDELDFAAQTLQRATNIIARFASTKAPEDMIPRDRECARSYRFAALVHTFALLSLTAAALGTPADSSVISTAFEMLRKGALDAYAAASAGLALRSSVVDESDIVEASAEDVSLADWDLGHAQDQAQ